MVTRHLLWIPGEPGTITSGAYRITADRDNPHEHDVRRNGEYIGQFRDLRAAKNWCAADAERTSA